MLNQFSFAGVTLISLFCFLLAVSKCLVPVGILRSPCYIILWFPSCLIFAVALPPYEVLLSTIAVTIVDDAFDVVLPWLIVPLFLKPLFLSHLLLL